MIDVARRAEPEYADDDNDGHGEGFSIRAGLSWSARQLVEKLNTIARGVMLISGEPGGGKDLFTISTSSIFKYAFNRPIIMDFKPNRLFGQYTLFGVNEIIDTIRAIAKAKRVAGIEDSADKMELAQFMEEETVKWLLEGEGYDLFKGAVYYISELKKVAHNRNPMSRTNKFTGTLCTVWRHLDLLFMGTHVKENEIDVKAFLEYAKLRTYCRQTLKPDEFIAVVSRRMYAGSDFVVSNVRFKSLVIPINGREPREYLGGKCFYDLYHTKHMRF